MENHSLLGGILGPFRQLLQSDSFSFVDGQTGKSKDQAPKQHHYFSRIGPECLSK